MDRAQFAFISGSLCLDFVDTLGNRRAEPVERLLTPADLDTWLEAAGLAGSPRKPSTPAILAQARELRDAVYRFGSAAIDKAPGDSADIATINRWATKMPLRPSIDGRQIRFTAARPIEAALSTIAADAVELILGPRRSRIRVCPECRMVFVDTSRPGMRRWCSSDSGCGNRAKVRAYRSRAAVSS
jgi:predicted RNA-binding Zn ribbon-like protein